MEPRLLNLKNDFNNLINIRNNVKNIFEILQLRIDKLKLLYSEFIQNNKNLPINILAEILRDE